MRLSLVLFDVLQVRRGKASDIVRRIPIKGVLKQVAALTRICAIQERRGVDMAWHGAVVMLAWLAGVALHLQQTTLPGVSPWWPGVFALGLWGLWLRSARLRMRLQSWAPGCPWGVCVASAAALLLSWAVVQGQAQRLASQVWPEQLSPVPHAATGEAPDEVATVWLTGRVSRMADRQDWGWSVQVDVQQWEVRSSACASGAVCQWQAGSPWSLPGLPTEAATPRRISLSLPLHMAEPVPGDVWRWPVVVRPLAGKRNPGGFDLELWLWEQGIRVAGKLDDKAAAPLLVQPAGWGTTGWMERWRSACRARIQAHVPDARVAGLIRGLTIGEQGALSASDWDALRTTGTAHLASISGLHVTMMGALLSGVVGGLWRCSPRLMRWWPAPVAAGVGGLLGATLYAWMAGGGLPAQRTVWMLAVVVLLRLSGRRWPWPLTLLLAAVVVTALDPWALMAPGFWLSFVAVGVLMWGGGDAWVAPGASRGAVIRHALRELSRAQALATVGLAPLSMVFFQTFSVIGLMANLWCIPLFTLLLTPLALLGLGIAPLWRVLEPVARWTLDGLTWAATWPWSVWQVPAVSTWAAALAVLSGAWMLAPVSWRWRLLAVPACLPLLWSTSASRQLPMPAAGEFDVMAADVGQGTAVLVRTARHALLFDTGPQSGPEHDAGRQVLIGMLRAMGVSTLDVLMLSHGDRDHIGGAASLLKAVRVHSVQSSLAPDHPLLSTVDLHRRKPAHQPCVAGQSWQWEGVQFQVLHPFAAHDQDDEDEKLGDNARSCVLRVSAHGRQVLLTGDIEAAQEAALVDREGAAGLNSEVLLVPHHGSRTSSTPDFLAAVQPQVAVVQVAARNAYGHPHPLVMARYQAMDIPTVTSPACGAWWWSSEGQSADQTDPQRCWRHRSPRYWQASRPDVHHLGP